MSGVYAEQAAGRARGSLFFTGFGSLWIYTALLQTGHGTPRALMLLAVSAAALLAGTAILFRRARELPTANMPPVEAERMRRMFAAVNIIQWVSIGTAVGIFGLLHMPQYIVTAIAIIVGLHLFPLAGAFRYRQHYVTGTLLILWSLGCLIALPRARLSGITALGVGTVLLVSAASTLLKTLNAARAPQPHAVTARG